MADLWDDRPATLWVVSVWNGGLGWDRRPYKTERNARKAFERACSEPNQFTSRSKVILEEVSLQWNTPTEERVVRYGRSGTDHIPADTVACD